jgi:hypothetical protein
VPKPAGKKKINKSGLFAFDFQHKVNADNYCNGCGCNKGAGIPEICP